MRGGAPKLRVWRHPTRDPECGNQQRSKQDYLPGHVQAVPERSVRHFFAVRVAHCFRQPAARADPAAVRTFAPAVYDQRNDYKCLQKRNRQPPPHWLRGEDVPDKQRPREHESESAPVFAAVVVVDDWEEVVRDGFHHTGIEPPVVTHQRQDNVRKQEERDELKGHQRIRLQTDVRRIAATNPAQAERKNCQRVGSGVVESGLRQVDGQCSEKCGWIGRSRGDRTAHGMQPAWHIKRKPVSLLKKLVQVAAGLPDINKRAKRDERQKTDGRAGGPLTANGNTRAAEEIERGFAPQHREHHVVRKRL